MKINNVLCVGVMFAVSFSLLLSPILGADKNDALKTAYESAKKDIFFLASDDCEGRGPLTKGLDLAADYISQKFKAAGLKPLGKDGSYFQPFNISGAKLDEKPRLLIKSENFNTDSSPINNRRFKFAHRTPAVVKQDKTVSLEAGKDFEAMGLSQSGKASAPLVFAGFGMTVDDGKKYDDYAKIDAKGKIVVVLRDAPKFKDEAKIFDSNGKKTVGVTYR